MSKEIKKRDGFFKLFHKYNNNRSYNKRKEELEKENIELEKGDGWAMFLASFFTLFLPALAILGLTIFLGLLFFHIIPW
ncbi:MAG: hypothetical protein J5880_03725 [Bacilli bacterium]|nr:hypothetical protein [Bacilli bacterium]